MSIRRPRFMARRRRPRPTCHRRDGPPLAAIYQVVVECNSERDQRRVYERMIVEGHKCRVLTL